MKITKEMVADLAAHMGKMQFGAEWFDVAIELYQNSAKGQEFELGHLPAKVQARVRKTGGNPNPPQYPGHIRSPKTVYCIDGRKWPSVNKAEQAVSANLERLRRTTFLKRENLLFSLKPFSKEDLAAYKKLGRV